MNIDLGRKMDSPSSVVSQPEGGEEKVYYPSLYIDGVKGNLDDLPDEGELTVKDRKTSSTTSTRDGKTTHSLSLDIFKIVGCESAPESTSGKDKKREDDLDKMAAEEAQKSSDEGENEQEY